MSNLALSLTISAIENVTKALERIGKQTEDTNKKINKSNEYYANKDKREQEKHEHWKTNLTARETAKRLRAEENAQLQKRNMMLKTEQEFRSTAQRMALYTVAPTAIMSTLSMRAYMEMEQRLVKMKMLFGKEAADMEKFAQDYALQTAFTIQNTTDLIQTIEMGKNTLGIKSNQEIKDLSKIIGNVILAYAPSAEQQTGVMKNIAQAMNSGVLQAIDVREMARWGFNLNGIAQEVGFQKKGDMWTAEEITQVFKLAEKTNKVQTAITENAKTFTQAFGMAGESIKLVEEGLGKTLDKQFNLTNFTKSFSEIIQKVGMQLKEDNQNFTKGMASYLTMLGLTVAPTLMLLGHWKKLSFLIGESNMKFSVFKDRLLVTAGIMSGLYLSTVDWGSVLKQYEEEGFFKATLNNLDKVIALMMVGGTLWKAIQALYAFWIAKEARLTALAVIKAAALNPKNLIAVGGAAAAIGGTYLLAQGFGGKSGEEINKDMGYDPLARMLGNENQSYASGRDVAMLEYMSKSQPNIEVINNINVDKSGNVSVETKTKGKETYQSPYSAPIMSDFSLGY